MFIGAAIWYLRQHPARPRWHTNLRKFTATGALVALIGSYLLLGYPPQPLMPSANVLSESLPADQPLVFLHEVNTVYQERMLSFVELHRGYSQFVVADVVTTGQAPAFGSRNLQNHILFPSYLEAREELDASQVWEILALHWPGKSGPLEEQAELRTKQRIYEIATAPSHNMIYDNGASFMVWRSPVDSK